MKKPSFTGESLLALWDKSQGLPLGTKVFSKALGWMIPYTGSISAQVEKLEAGSVVVRLKDRRSVRNHLSSIHAIALANIGEFSTGLALTSRMPKGSRAILASLKIDYLKKARGTLRAEAQAPAIEDASVKSEHLIVGEIYDEARVLVARVEAKWVVGPGKEPA
jgi:acyl-coenzyme A thioesterase PaaI-like protein